MKLPKIYCFCEKKSKSNLIVSKFLCNSPGLLLGRFKPVAVGDVVKNLSWHPRASCHQRCVFILTVLLLFLFTIRQQQNSFLWETYLTLKPGKHSHWLINSVYNTSIFKTKIKPTFLILQRKKCHFYFFTSLVVLTKTILCDFEQRLRITCTASQA